MSPPRSDRPGESSAPRWRSGWAGCARSSSSKTSPGKLVAQTASGLADYGGLNNLLECVNTYLHEVASLNAANVFNLRAAAEVLRGGAEICAEAGCHLAGGHSIDDREPNLVLSGGPSSLIPLRRLAEVAAAIPGARLTTIPVGHRVHSLAPGRFTAEVIAFLAEEAGRPRLGPGGWPDPCSRRPAGVASAQVLLLLSAVLLITAVVVALAHLAPR